MTNGIAKPLLIASLVIVAVWLLPFVCFYWAGESAGLQWQPRELVDVYGALNTLFAGLAFAGVVITLVLQMSEITENRKEFARTAKAQEASAKLTAITFLIEDATKQIEYWGSIRNRAATLKTLPKGLEDSEQQLKTWIFRKEALIDELNREIVNLSSESSETMSKLLDLQKLVRITSGM